MTKWYEWFSFQTHEKIWDAFEEIENILSNKGNLRVLIIMYHVTGMLKGYFKKKKLRFTEIKEVTKLPLSTLRKSLDKLCEKGLVTVVYFDVKTPRKDSQVPHYELTDKGFEFCTLNLMGYKTLLIDRLSAARHVKLLLPNEKAQ